MRVLIHILRVATIRAMERLANVLAISRDVQRSGPVNHYPDFLYPERDGRAELGKERRFYAGNDSIRIVTAAGELWIFPDGHRLLLSRPQKKITTDAMQADAIAVLDALTERNIASVTTTSTAVIAEVANASNIRSATVQMLAAQVDAPNTTAASCIFTAVVVARTEAAAASDKSSAIGQAGVRSAGMTSVNEIPTAT